MPVNKDILRIIKTWRTCTDCPAHKTAHVKVFFRGTAPCDVVFIGEAPGNDEDMYGEPFIGRAGKLLDQWIEDSAHDLFCNGFYGGQVDEREPFTYGILNILACRPCDENGKIRQPTEEEAKACSPRVADMLRACKPQMIVLLGQVAKKHHKIPRDLDHIPVIELQHPAYVLRNGGVGSYAFDSNLIRLTEALETHLYGQEESTEEEHVSKQAPQVRRKTAPRSRQDQKKPSQETRRVKGSPRTRKKA